MSPQNQYIEACFTQGHEDDKTQSVYEMSFGISHIHYICIGEGYVLSEVGVKVVTNKEGGYLKTFNKEIQENFGVPMNIVSVSAEGKTPTIEVS